MDHLTSSNWWWNVAFSGIASSLISVAVGVAAVLYGLHWDRRSAERAAFLADCQHARLFARELMAEESKWAASAGDGRLTDHPNSRTIWTLITDLEALQSRADSERSFSQLLEAVTTALWDYRSGILQDLPAAERQSRANTVFGNVEHLLQARISRPNWLKSLPEETLQQQLEYIRGGDETMFR